MYPLRGPASRVIARGAPRSELPVRAWGGLGVGPTGTMTVIVIVIVIVIVVIIKMIIIVIN